MRVLIFLLSVGAVVVIASACSSPACNAQCASNALDIQSGASDLVSASGCGQTAACGAQQPCGELFLPPPVSGGACTVTVKFSDGSTTTVDADWGAAHSGPCCMGFDHPPAAVHLHESDGGQTSDGGLVAQCETQAQHFATLCAGDDIRPCLWNAYAKLCATGKTQLLVDSMNCLDQTTCRTFSDPNEAATCLSNVHATGESQASKDFVQNECTACGNPCPTIGGDAEIVPYLTDADVASLASCSSGACTIDAVIQQCASVQDVGYFDVCEE
ncbi:MAG TPA: hypothetical protein VGH28_24460 [Polyangiaceae bacterium]|jgi:hypothetical protein